MSVARVFRALCLLPCTLLFAEQLAIPVALPASRYDKLLEDSPFAVATPTAPVAEPEKPWAENLSLGSVALQTTREGKEIPFVIVKRRGDLTGTFALIGSTPGPDGIELVKIEWSDNPAKTSAIVKKGTEFATLKPNEADFTPPPPPPQGQGVRPGVVNPLQINNPGAVRKTPVVLPGTQAIPRPGAVPPATNPAPAANDRKRIRVIPNAPAAR